MLIIIINNTVFNDVILKFLESWKKSIKVEIGFVKEMIDWIYLEKPS